MSRMFEDRIVVRSDRQRKSLAILDMIRKNGPISRTDISKVTGFNIVTVSNYMNNFIEKKLVSEKGYGVSTGGRIPTLVELNPKSTLLIGVGLNITDIVGVVVDLRSNILFKVKKERTSRPDEELIRRVIGVVEELLEKSKLPREDVKGIGIGIPGIIAEKGHTIRWPGGLGTDDIFVSVSLKDLIEDKFGIPAIVENDADAAVFGEKWISIDAEVRDMIYMYSGVACGIIINGEIYHGWSGCAGELGIVHPVEKDPKTLEREALGLGRWSLVLGMIDEIKERLSKGQKSAISDIVKGDTNKINFKTIIEAFETGDAMSRSVIENAGYHLGRKIAFLANLLSPEMVIIGGGIEQAGDVLLDSIRKSVRMHAIEEVTNGLKIVPAQLGEDAIALGAASIAAERHFMQG